MADPPARPEPGWEAGWDAHAAAQRARTAALPFAEKLRWLEEAQHLLAHLRRGPAPRDPASHDAPGR